MSDSSNEERNRTELTEEELKEIRAMLEEERRAKWLWSSIRIWSIWIVGVIGCITLMWDSMGRVLKAIVGK